MSDFVSAKPELLSTFVSTQTTKAKNLDTQRISDSKQFFSFVGKDGTGSCGQGCVDLISRHAADLVYELGEIALFVQIVHDALLQADVMDEDGVVRFTGDLQPYLDAQAARYGLKFSDVAKSDIITKDEIGPMTVGTVPEMSGFVNDPVCTATGHLLIDARDFVMPSRLDVLSFRRTYASRDVSVGAFGPGWWSWTECRSEVLADGSFVYHGPDALEFSVEPFGDGTFVGRPELDVQVADIGNDRFELRWGRRSRYPNQRWTFASGRLVEVSGPFLGTNTFHYGSSGLSRISHDSGRSISLRWSRSRVVAIESSDGRVARFSYDRHGRLIEVDNAVSPETYEVDDRGQILAITDADGVRAVTMMYDDDGRVIEQVTPAGFMTRFGYDSPRRTTLEDREHNPLSVYTHDEQGRVEMYATGGGLRFTRRFDDLGRIVSQRDPDGTSFTFDESFEGTRRIEELQWSSGAIDHYTYDHADRLIAQSSPSRSVTFDYDDDTVFPSRIRFVGDEGMSLGLRWQHGVPTQIEDGDGVVDAIEVRADGTIAAMTNGYGATTRYSVHPSGGVSRIDYADGRVVSFERDAAGRLLTIVDAAGGRAELRYTPAGRLVSTIDQAGSPTTIEYDDSGAPQRVISADGVATEFMFDDLQRAVGVKFANGDTIGLELDEFGRQIAVDVGGDRWLTERDPNGRITKSVDPSGKPAYQTYGEQVQWSEITDAAGATSRIEMDLAHRVTSLKNQAGEFEATYAATGLVRSHTTESGDTREFSYTPAGRVSKVVEGDAATECRYDEAGQVVAVNYGSGWWTFDRDGYGHITRRVSPAGREQRFGYDVLGNVRSIEVDGATWRFDYDPLGRVTGTTDPTGRSKTYSYDAMGRMVESRDGRSVPLRYEYDLRGRISALVDNAGGSVQFEHNQAGNLTSIVDQLGRRTVVNYDAAGRHIGTQYFDHDGSVLSPNPLAGMSGDDMSVEFAEVVPLSRTDAADRSVTTWTLPGGERVELRRDADGFVTRLDSPGFVRTFERDHCGRIVAVTDVGGDTSTTTTLARDAAGRVVEQNVDGTVTRYGYDDAGQLVRVEGPDGISEWEYDEVGRLVAERTARGERSFAYDAAHQLVSLTDGDDVTTFEYDARGRRVRAKGRHDVVYVWGDQWLEAVITDGHWTRLSFDASGRLSRFGDHSVQWHDGGEISEPASVDGMRVISLGTATFGTVDETGNVTWRPFTIADAWGDTSPAASGDGATWHDYYGVGVDGIVWLGARPYDITTRQFLSPDPLAPVPAGAGEASPYTYAFNDPINFVDPTGRKGQPINREDFNDIVDRHTGVQWGNIARVGGAILTVAACVAATVLTAGAASPLLLAGISAGGALLTGVVAEGLEATTHTGDGSFNTGPIVRDTLLGFAGGYAGGLAGRAVGPLAGRLATTTGIPQRLANGAVTFTSEGLVGAAEGTLGEVYDVAMPAGLRPYLGGDGRFDGGQIGVTAGTNAVLGTVADEVVPRLPGLNGATNAPTGGVADPGNITPTASPAPDLPNPSPAPQPGTTGPDPTPTSNGDGAPTNAGDNSPTNAGDSTPTSDGDGTPTNAGDNAPTNAGDSTPTSNGDGTPTNAGDNAPTNAGDSTPTNAGDSTPTNSGDSSPTNAGDSSPTTSGDSSPTNAGDSSPSSNGDGTPSNTGDSTPTNAGDSSPTTSGDSSPTNAGDRSPSSNGDGTPSNTGDSTPTSTGDSSPTNAGDTTPTSNGDTTPTNAGDTSPTSNGDTTPTNAGDSSPTTSGDSSPTNAGDSSPTTSGDSSPTNAGDSTPTSSGDSSPTNAGDSSPTNAGDTTPTSNGDTTPTNAGDSTPPANAGDTTPTNSGDSTPPANAPSDSTPASSGESTTAANGDTTPDAGDPTPTNSGDSGAVPADTAAAAAGGAVAARGFDATPTVASDTAPNGLNRVQRHYGENRFEYTTDGTTTRAAKFEINESTSGLNRTTAETNAQQAAADQGLATDHGGHIVGHRFASNQGEINMFPQDAQFNNSAYRTMENEWAGWAARGYQVEGMVSLNPPGALRPDTVDVSYVVTDPRTGDIVDYTSVRFRNQAGQTFDRVPSTQMGTSTTGLTVRPDGDAPAATAPTTPSPGGSTTLGGDTTPSAGGSTPTANGGTTSTGNGDSTARVNGDSTPTVDSDAAPTVNGDSTPTVNGDSTPTVNGDSTPTVNGDSTPTVNGDSTPTVNGDAAPTVSGDSTPTVNGDAAPTVSGDSTPTVNGDTGSTVSGDSTPAASADSTPAASADSPPTVNGDTTPTVNGDATPAAAGDATPAMHGDAAPATPADGAPATAGDPTPTANGDTTPTSGNDGPAATNDSAAAANSPTPGDGDFGPNGSTDPDDGSTSVSAQPRPTDITSDGSGAATPPEADIDVPVRGGDETPPPGGPPNGPGPDGSPVRPPRSAHEIVAEALADTALFTRHGFDQPWSQQDLIDRISTRPSDLSTDERAVLNEIRDRIPLPARGELVQKVITPAQVNTYLNNVVNGSYGPNTIGGSITRDIDTAHLHTPRELHDGLRLDYDNTPFTPDMDGVHVIRFVPEEPDFVIPRNSAMGGSTRFDEWDWPFTGNGFTSALNDVVPEVQSNNTLHMQDGAQMFQRTPNGERAVAVLENGEWQLIGGDDAPE